MTKPRLSVLDQTPVGEDHTPDQALRASVDLARAAETLGYTRYWAAEHHGSPGFASSAPEILAGALLAHTSHMRIGTGGVLLPRYDPAKVAEVFGVLASLHPGRVDLGIGRAGGLARDFPQRLAQLTALLGEGGVVPHPPVPPQMWLLGAGRESARLAGLLGTEFTFGHFFSPAGGTEAFDDYRAQFRRATGRPAGGALAVRVVTADSAGRAEELAQSLLLWRARKDLGQDAPLPSYETTRRHRWTGAGAGAGQGAPHGPRLRGARAGARRTDRARRHPRGRRADRQHPDGRPSRPAALLRAAGRGLRPPDGPAGGGRDGRRLRP
ncbi:MsnO8 family LLM class oxidoreductase [Streptomyces yangpuensis]